MPPASIGTSLKPAFDATVLAVGAAVLLIILMYWLLAMALLGGRRRQVVLGRVRK